MLLLSFGSEASGGELVVTMLLLGMLMTALRDLLQAWDYRLNFEEGRRRIGEVLVAPRLRETSGAKSLDGAGPLALEYRDVGVDEALVDVSVAAAPGERVLVSGGHGSGKSTLLGLAARLFDPSVLPTLTPSKSA